MRVMLYCSAMPQLERVLKVNTDAIDLTSACLHDQP